MRVQAGAACLVAAAVALSGCAEAEPGSSADPREDADIRILVDSQDTEGQVVAEIFKQAFARNDRNAELVVEDNTAGSSLVEKMGEDGNFWAACTGDALFALDPDRAREMEQNFSAGEASRDEDRNGQTHIAMMESLPTTLTTVDPSTAQGCSASPVSELPQNYSPIFTKGLLDREEKEMLGSLSKFLIEQDIDELVEEIESGDGDIEKVVSRWSQNSVPEGELDANSDSDSSEE
ncbi:hypothetical protein [Corynebacterium confusum]